MSKHNYPSITCVYTQFVEVQCVERHAIMTQNTFQLVRSDGWTFAAWWRIYLQLTMWVDVLKVLTYLINKDCLLWRVRFCKNYWMLCATGWNGYYWFVHLKEIWVLGFGGTLAIIELTKSSPGINNRLVTMLYCMLKLAIANVLLYKGVIV